MNSVHLKSGREASVLRRHPWIYSGAIEKVTGNPGSGDNVRVYSKKGELLGVGGYSPQSQIRVRMYDFGADTLGEGFFGNAISAAINKRKALHIPQVRSAYRLIYGESDGLPGLIVDKYNDYLVCQFLFAGMENHRAALIETLAETSGCGDIYERSDASVREKEGLEPRVGVLMGAEPPEYLAIEESSLRIKVSLAKGHKTGYYLDQAENRQLVAAFCRDKRVLNCFSYTGGFGLAALQHGATQVTSIDISSAALALAAENTGNNGFPASNHELVCGNVFDTLRQMQQQQREFDLIILDPPKFAENKQQVMKAARAYKDLALQAAKLLSPGGMLVNFSCSGAIDLNLFQKITADALLDAGRQGAIIRYLHQAADHPVALNFPESQYLKGLVTLLD